MRHRIQLAINLDVDRAHEERRHALVRKRVGEAAPVSSPAGRHSRWATGKKTGSGKRPGFIPGGSGVLRWATCSASVRPGDWADACSARPGSELVARDARRDAGPFDPPGCRSPFAHLAGNTPARGLDPHPILDRFVGSARVMKSGPTSYSAAV